MEKFLKLAVQELGVQEIPGPEHNPEIIKYSSETGLSWITSDETPWCSSFINWCAMKAGLNRSGKANARSWLSVGTKTTNPEPGDVVVFWRDSIESHNGHVGIFMGFNHDGSRVFVLGGNQGNRVSVSSYPANRVLAFQKLASSKTIVAPDPTLQKGDRGEKVISLQNALKAIGIDVGTSDGVFGERTFAGVKALQTRAANSVIDGIYGPKSHELLISILQQ